MSDREQTGFPVEGKNGRVWVVGTTDHDGERIVEVSATEVVPDGTVIGYDKPTLEGEYDRKSTLVLSVESSRKLANTLNRMADKMERADNENTDR